MDFLSMDISIARWDREAANRSDTNRNIDYDVYHDESKEAGYWHGILFVPRFSRTAILDHLRLIRETTDFRPPLSLKDVHSCGKRFQCSRAVVKLAVAAMMQDSKGQSQRVYISSRCFDEVDEREATNYRQVIQVTKPLKMRFVVFRERDSHRLLDPEGQFLDYGAKIETTLRMAWKGGLHLLFSENDPARIMSLHLDGYEHYRRHADADRIVGRLKSGGLRSYCEIAEDAAIDDRSSDPRKDNAQEYDDCQFLQITDLLIGSFRTVLADCKNAAQAKVAHPVNDLVERWRGGAARMKNSRWFRAFCISECFLENGEWHFASLPAKEHPDQMCLSL
jgi:hypothetical protein